MALPFCLEVIQEDKQGIQVLKLVAIVLHEYILTSPLLIHIQFWALWVKAKARPALDQFLAIQALS